MSNLKKPKKNSSPKPNKVTDQTPEAIKWRKDRAKKAHKAWLKKHGKSAYSVMGHKSAKKLTKKQLSQRGKVAVEWRIAKRKKALIPKVD